MTTVVVVLKTGEVYTYGPFPSWDAAAKWRDQHEMYLWQYANIAVHTPVEA